MKTQRTDHKTRQSPTKKLRKQQQHNNPTKTEPPLVVDLNFRDAFTQAKSRPWYDALMAAVPQDFVGSLHDLTFVAGVMAAAGRLLFRQLALPLPPWREPRAVLSRWVASEPDAFEDADVPLIPVPAAGAARGLAPMLAPYHAPFRRAVEAAAALGERGAGGGGERGARGGRGGVVDALGSAALLSGYGRGLAAGTGARAPRTSSGGGNGGGGLLRSQLAAAQQRLATREPAAPAVPMVLPSVATGGGVGAGGVGGGAALEDAAPRRVIFGFPVDQQEALPHRLRRSSAPAWAGAGAGAGAVAGATAAAASGRGAGAGASGGADGADGDDEEDPMWSDAAGAAGSAGADADGDADAEEPSASVQQPARHRAGSGAPAAPFSRSNSDGALLNRALSQSVPSPGGGWPWALELGDGAAPHPPQLQAPSPLKPVLPQHQQQHQQQWQAYGQQYHDYQQQQPPQLQSALDAAPAGGLLLRPPVLSDSGVAPAAGAVGDAGTAAAALPPLPPQQQQQGQQQQGQQQQPQRAFKSLDQLLPKVRTVRLAG